MGNQQVIDIHCHPTLKMKLLNYRFYDYVHQNVGTSVTRPESDEIFHMQYDLPKMSAGNVRTIWSAIYVVEKGLVDNSEPLSFLNWLTKGLGFEFDHAIERTDTPAGPYNQLLEQMDMMELQVSEALNHGFNAGVPRSYNEFLRFNSEGKICVLHAVEGAHMLGRNIPDENTCADRIRYLSLRGVCSITLAHFMPNDICYPSNGISPDTKAAMGFEFDYGRYIDEGLTSIGVKAVETMFEEGIIVDLNHLSLRGRNDVYSINGSYKRPLIFSHNGLRRNVGNYEYITPEDWEVIRIRNFDGVIGVNFMNYWLNGTENEQNDNGIQNVIKTIRDIAKICGETESDDESQLNYNHACIGSDMDGFTQPLDDLYNASLIDRLVSAMRSKGISEENINKVLFENANRVMQKGWRTTNPF